MLRFPRGESPWPISLRPPPAWINAAVCAAHRTFATGLLVVMGAAYCAAVRSGLPGFWMDLFRAGTEAALVGGLADWFAVTALFRRPLGLPIPHTAVIPNSKDRIGAGLGSFIERHFLEPKLVAARLRSLGTSRRLGVWLADRRNADVVSDRLIVIAAFLFRSFNDQKLQRMMQMTLRRQLRGIELAPALATLLSVLRRNGCPWAAARSRAGGGAHLHRRARGSDPRNRRGTEPLVGCRAASIAK